MVRLAIREALKSPHKHKLGAVIVSGGKPVAAAHNFGHIHAEHAAINHAWRSDIDGCSIIVVRVVSDGSLGMAYPCNTCLKRMISVGIKKVYYSYVDGSIRELKLTSLPIQLDDRLPILYPYMIKNNNNNKKQRYNYVYAG
jgi:pyrimidine deaminase RibD-like protein